MIKNEIIKVTFIGILANAVLIVIKFIVGIYGNSKALIADAIHSFSDFGTDLLIIIGAKYWHKPPDTDHPYGHRKIESLITIIIGFVLCIVGIMLIYNGLTTLTIYNKPNQYNTPSKLLLFVAFISILLKELLYQWTVKVGKRLKSSALIANAWHHRSDAFSSIPVALALSINYYFPNCFFLDNIAAIIVATFLIQTSIKIALQPVYDLLEQGAEKEVINKIEEIISTVPEVKGYHKIRTRCVSSAIFVDLHIHVSPSLSITEAHKISGIVKKLLLDSNLNIIDVLIHIEPYQYCTYE